MHRADDLNLCALQAVLLPVVHPPGHHRLCRTLQFVLKPCQLHMIGAVPELIHQFDELQNKVFVACRKPDEIRNLIPIDALHQDHIQLDRRQPCCNRRVNPCQHIREHVLSGNLFVALRLQGIQADIHPGEPCILQLLCHILKNRAVGGHRCLHPFRHHRNDLNQIVAHQRLSAGKLDAAHLKVFCNTHDLADIIG